MGKTKYVYDLASNYLSLSQNSGDTKNTMSKSILEAIDAISQNNVRTSNAALTIEATITEIEDAGLGIYKVNYRDNSFSAQSSSKAYKVGDVVYVLVPEGDFSKPKMIIGSLANTPSTIVDEDVADYIILTDNNLLEDEEEVNQIFNLCSYRPIPIPGEREKSELTFTLSQSFKEKLNNWIANKLRNLALSATMNVDIPPEQQQKDNNGSGNYGIEIDIPILISSGNEEEELAEDLKKIILDINTFQGFPYSTDGKDVLQISLGQLEENESIDLSEDENRQVRIIIFVYGFPNPNNRDPFTMPNDIIIKDISLDVITFLSNEEKQGYFLSLVASEGPLFVENSHKIKTLTPYLKINGKESNIQDNYKCYLFIEDNFIKNTSDRGYTDVAGIGLKCLNNIAEDGTYITNEYTLDIKREDVYYISRYRCILVQDSMTISADIEIKETLNQLNFSLVTDTSSYLQNTVANLRADINFNGEDASNIEQIYISYNRYNIDDVLISDNINVTNSSDNKSFSENKYYLETISLPVASIDRLNTIRCTFHVLYSGSTEHVLIGSTSAIVKVADNDFILAIQEGNVLYKYDSAGNSPLMEVYSNLNSAINYITPLTFKLYKSDGTEFTEREYDLCSCTLRISTNSMLTFKNVQPKEDGYYYINTRTLYYNIADSFNPLKTDNLVTLTVTSKLLDKVLQDNVNINFIKEGEIGTNNSKYAAIVTYKNFGYGQVDDDGNIRKFQILYSRISQSFWYSYIVNDFLQQVESSQKFNDFNVKLYSQGKEIIFNIEDNKYKIDLGILNRNQSNSILFITENNEIQINNYVDISTQDEQVNNTTILVAKITIDNAEEIYAYYPVEFIVINIEDVEKEQEVLRKIKIPNIASGFDKVLYDIAGTNPQLNSSKGFELDNCVTNVVIEEDLPITRIFNCNLSSRGILTGGEIQDDIYESPPADIYLKEDNKVNFVKTIAERIYSNKDRINERIEEIKVEKQNNNSNIEIIDNFINDPTSEKNINYFFESKVSSIASVKRFLTNFPVIEIEDYEKIIQYFNMRDTLLKLLHTIADNIFDIKKCLLKYSLDNSLGTDILNDRILYNEKILLQSVENRRSRVFREIKLIPYKYGDFLEQLLNNLAGTNEEAKEELRTLYSIYYDNALIFEQKISTIPPIDGGAPERLLTKMYDNIFNHLFFLGYLVVPEGLINYSFKELIDFHTNIQPILKRISSPIDNLIDINSLEEGHQLCEEKLNTAYPVYSSKDEFLNIVLPSIENLMSQNKDIEYYKKASDIAISQLNDRNEYLDSLLEQYDLVLNYFEYPQFTIIKPIIVLVDNQSAMDINGLMENHIPINTNDGTDLPDEIIDIPVFGAGDINNDNGFTGVAFGTKVTEEQSTRRSRAVEPTITTQRGLYSYNNGIESYCLNAEDGSTIIGTRNSGQVLADPGSRALLYSSNYLQDYKKDGKPLNYEDSNKTPEQQGILIDLTNSDIQVTYKDQLNQLQTKSIIDLFINGGGHDDRVDQLIAQVNLLTEQNQILSAQIEELSTKVEDLEPYVDNETIIYNN